MVEQVVNLVEANLVMPGEVEIGWTVLVLDHYVTLVMKTKDR